MPTPAAIQAKIRKEGEPVVLKRPGSADLALVAFVRGYKADELVGAVQQGDREARISGLDFAAAGWPAAPRKGDQLMIRGRTTAVQSCETRTLRGVDAVHVLQVRG